MINMRRRPHYTITSCTTLRALVLGVCSPTCSAPGPPPPARARPIVRAAAGGAGVAIPVGIEAVLSERISRVAGHVFPRARFGNGARQTQATRESRLRVLVLVERLPPSAANGPKRPIQRHRKAETAAPFAREVPRIDLLEGPFLRGPAFFVATAGSSVSRERH